MKFTQKENEVLSETFRRLCQFHNGDVDTTLLVLDTPSSVKTLITKSIFKKAGDEVRNSLNWYSLTNKGKELFKIAYSQHSKLAMLNGDYAINFNPILESIK